MANLSNQSQKPLPLEKAYTFFMVPFYYQGNEWDEIHAEKLDKWIPIKTQLFNKEDVLYPYIMNMFHPDDKASESRLKIFELKAEDLGINSKLFVERVLGKKSVAVIANNSSAQKNPSCITFILKKDGNFAPHIFISPASKIGILTFAIELEDSRDIDSLKLLNYFLQKRDEIEKYQCVCIKPDNQEKIVSDVEMKKSASEIPDLWTWEKGRKKCSQASTRNNPDHLCWDINDFIDCLLATMGKPKPDKPRIRYFSKDRIHTFTFCSIDDPQDMIDEKTVTPDLLRLSRSVIDSYLLPFESMVQQGAVLKTYDNIFFSSAAEGSAMLCIAKPVNKPFVDNIHNVFNRQYLLIYLLVIIQRYTLLSMVQKLTEFESKVKESQDYDSDKLKIFDKELWTLIDTICGIKVHCYYTDVSIYTHHSQFYQHCCKNMHIQETFAEVDNKLELLKLTTNRRIQESLEEQKKQQEEVNNRIKEKEKLEEQERNAAERRQNILSWLVGILTVAQVMQACYELSKHDETRDICALWFSLALGAICVVLLVALMWKDIIKFFRKSN